MNWNIGTHVDATDRATDNRTQGSFSHHSVGNKDVTYHSKDYTEILFSDSQAQVPQSVIDLRLNCTTWRNKQKYLIWTVVDLKIEPYYHLKENTKVLQGIIDLWKSNYKTQWSILLSLSQGFTRHYRFMIANFNSAEYLFWVIGQSVMELHRFENYKFYTVDEHALPVPCKAS